MDPSASRELQFGFDRSVSLLVKTRRSAEPFVQSLGPRHESLSFSSGKAKAKSTRGGKKPLQTAPFASVTMAGSATPASSKGASGAAMPLFMLASAKEEPKVSSSAPAWRHFVGNLAAGAVAGCSVEGALYPIDTIKTRLQAMVGGGGFKALLDSGGGKGLYAGIWGNLAGTAPSSALFISVYEPAKHLAESVLDKEGGEHSHLAPLFAGASAGVVSSLVRVPTEVIKQRLQTREFARLGDAVSGIIKREGFRGLYAGYGAFLLRDLPFDAIEFGAYEMMKSLYRKSVSREVNSAETSLIGAIAGGFTGLVTTPLDVLKTRLMTQGVNGIYKNSLDATIQILQKEGPSAFMSGWQPRLIWISLGGFVFFPVLEASKKYFAPKEPEPEPAPSVSGGKKK